MVITALHKKGDKTECGNYRGISLVSHVGKVYLEVVARRLAAYCEDKGLLPEEQSVFQPDHPTTDMMFVISSLQKIRRKAGVSFFMCVIDLQKAYDTVDGTLTWQVLTHIGVPPQMTAAIKQLHDGMRACVQPLGAVCGLVRGETRTTARIRAIPDVGQHLLRSRADYCPLKLQREHGRLRQVGAPEGTADVDGTGAGYGQRSSCNVRHNVRGRCLHSFGLAASAR